MITSTLKTCSICGLSFPFREFAYGRRENRSYCQECNKAERKARTQGGAEGARAFRDMMRSKWRRSGVQPFIAADLPKASR